MWQTPGVRSAARLLLILLVLRLPAPVAAGAVAARDGSKLARLMRLGNTTIHSGIQNLTAVGSSLFFTANGRHYGLWRTNGRPAGIGQLRQVTFPSDPFYLSEFGSAGGKLFFTREASAGGARQLWVTDGSRRGTRRLAERFAENLTAVGGTLFFTSFEGDANVLWKSDGTPGGTVQVAQITSTIAGLYTPTALTAVGTRLFFAADDGTHTLTLYVSDGTDAGTRRLTALVPRVGSPVVNIIDLGGVALVDDGRLWRSDGTVVGTQQILDPSPGAIRTTSSLVAGGRLFFAVDTFGAGAVSSEALWVSDGTAPGTHLVADGADGQLFAAVYGLGVLDGAVYFLATDPSGSVALWQSDATGSSAQRVTDLGTGIAPSSPSTAVTWQGQLFFVLLDQNRFYQIWRSDGTAGGTVAITDETVFAHRVLEGSPLIAAGQAFFFVLEDPLPRHGRELWSLRPRAPH